MKKPRCGEWMSHKYRVGKHGRRRTHCVRCGKLHADVAMRRRQRANSGKRLPKRKVDPLVELDKLLAEAWS